MSNPGSNWVNGRLLANAQTLRNQDPAAWFDVRSNLIDQLTRHPDWVGPWEETLWSSPDNQIEAWVNAAKRLVHSTPVDARLPAIDTVRFPPGDIYARLAKNPEDASALLQKTMADTAAGFRRAQQYLPKTLEDTLMTAVTKPIDSGVAGVVTPAAPNELAINAFRMAGHESSGSRIMPYGDVIKQILGTDAIPAHEAGHLWTYRALNHDPRTLLKLVSDMPGIDPGLYPSIWNKISGRDLATQQGLARQVLDDPGWIRGGKTGYAARSLRDYAATKPMEYIAEEAGRDIGQAHLTSAVPEGRFFDLVNRFAGETGMEGAANLRSLGTLGLGIGGLLLANHLTDGGITGGIKSLFGMDD